jgi:tRNA threonylcarbamoyl adenosine modification protein YeaZ
VLILAFDTATPAVTVALHDGTRAIARESAVDSRRHGELLAPAIARVLASAGVVPGDLTAIGVGVGPGPYTGLRAAVVTAQVLASALDITVDGICTLDVIAARARLAAGGEFIVATDARRREVYWARYSAAGERLSGPDVSLPAELPAGYPMAGDGAMLYAEIGGLADGGEVELIEPRYPDAAVLAAMVAERLAKGAERSLHRSDPDPPEPLYLRRPDAREPGRPKRVTPAVASAKVVPR